MRWALLVLLLISGVTRAAQMEMQSFSLPAVSAGDTSFVSVTFQRSFATPPLVFTLHDMSNQAPAGIRVRNVTTSSFEVVQVEPSGEDGVQGATTLHYLAVEAGVGQLPDGTPFEAGSISTSDVQRGPSVGGPQRWESVSFGQPFNGIPVLVAAIQTMANETGNVPGAPSVPWLQAVVRNTTAAGFDTALERSESGNGSVSADETIGFFAIDGDVTGGFVDALGSAIFFETLLTGDSVAGGAPGSCYTFGFSQSFASVPAVVGAKMSRDDNNGGWLRRCSLSPTQVGLVVDEDRSRDSERNHSTERAGVFAASAPFVLVDGGAALALHMDEFAWQGVPGEVEDSSGNGFDATAFNGVTTDGAIPAIAGQPGTCRYGDFDGVDDYVEVPHDPALNGQGALTYAAWVRPSRWDGIRQIMAKSVHSGGTGPAQMGIFSEANVLKGRAETINGRYEVQAALPPVDQWVHIALVFEADALRLYVDGVVVDTAVFASTTLNQTTDPLNISKTVGTSAYYFDGFIDEPRVYTEALDTAEVNQVLGETRPCAGPVAEWRFDEGNWNGTPGEVLDSSGFDRHGAAFAASPRQALLCNGADLRGDTTADYLDMNFEALDGVTDFTMLVWYRSADNRPAAVLSGARAGEDDEVLFRLRNRNQFEPFVKGDGTGRVGTINTADGGWHLLAWTRLAASNCLYIDDALQGCIDRPAGALDIDPGGLIIGQEQGSVGGGFSASQSLDGELDELLIFDRVLGVGELAEIRANNLSGLGWDGEVRSCPVVGAAKFVLDHDGDGIHCLPEPVIVTAVDATNAIVPAYAGEVTLTAGTGRGSWILASGNGVLVDAVLDDGVATYLFVPTDNATASFLLDYTDGPAIVDVDVYQTDDVTIIDDDSEGPLVFAPSGFTVTGNVLPNPPPGVIADPVGPQIAGATFPIHVAVYGTTDTDPQCGIIESYTGLKPVAFWTDHVDPSTGTRTLSVDTVASAASEAGAASQNVVFNAGQALIEGKYKDAGRIRLNLKDETSFAVPIRGASSSFVVTPAELAITLIESLGGFANQLATTPTGTGFVAAGEPFRVDVDVLDLEGSLTPNFGNESAPEGLTLDSAVLVLPAGERNVLSGGASFLPTATPGRFRNEAVAFEEVGAIRLQARVTDDDYLGTGSLIGALSDPVGRFYPHHFELLGGATLISGCGNFTYFDEPGLLASYTLAARAQGGATTENYSQTLLGVAGVARVEVVAENADDSVALSARLSGAVGTWTSGTITLLNEPWTFARDGMPDGPFDALRLGLMVDDTLDGRLLENLDMNPDTSGDCVAAGDCTAAQLGAAVRFRYGRMMVMPAFGPETQPLDVSLEAQYFNGTAFAVNDLDNCSGYSAPLVSLSDYTGNLSSGDTSVLGPAPGTVLVGGVDDPNAQLLLSPPLIGNDGSVKVTLDVPAWLEFDWQGAGQEDPAGVAQFGRFRGHDRIIFWREE